MGAGRPSLYSDKLAARICTLLAEGMSLRSICHIQSMPGRTTIMAWLANPENVEFRHQYAQAREAQADEIAEQVLEISDEQCVLVIVKGRRIEVGMDATAVARNKLRADARKWFASKVAPTAVRTAAAIQNRPACPDRVNRSSFSGD